MKTAGKTHFNFSIFEDPQKLASDIYHKGSLKDAKDDQYKMFTLLNYLRNYKSTNPDKTRERKETLTNAEMLYNSIFHVKMNLKKKNQMWLMKHYQIG